jgi:hypothetical protein
MLGSRLPEVKPGRCDEQRSGKTSAGGGSGAPGEAFAQELDEASEGR